jgi:hypothetical protein
MQVIFLKKILKNLDGLIYIFGKIHPFDIVAEGFLSRHLRLAARRLN